MQLGTGSLSKFKEQGYDTGVTFNFHILQRTACIHTAEVPYCHQQSYTQTASRTQSLASVTQSDREGCRPAQSCSMDAPQHAG